MRHIDLWKEALDVARERRPLLAERLAFYLGRHYGIMTDSSVRRRAAVDPRLAYEVYNYIRPGTKTVVQQRMSFFPNSRVLPRSASVLDRFIAKTTESILRGCSKGGPLTKRVVWNATAASEIYGWGFLKTYWSPIPWQHNKPGPRIDYCSPLDVIPDPQATTWSEVRRVFHRKILPVSTLRSQYQQTLDGSEPEFEEPSDETGRRSPILEYMGKNGWDGLGEVVEMWEFPSDENGQQGKLICFSGMTTFYDVPLPYHVPFQILTGSNKNPENPYAEGCAADAIAINMSLNQTENNLREALALSAAPMMAVPRQGKVRQGAFVAVAGQRVDYDGPWQPNWLLGPGPTPSSLSYADHQKQAIHHTLGVEGVIQGQTAPTNQPAKQTAFQKELYNENNSADNAIYQEEMQAVQRQYLRLLHDYMPENELVLQVGPGGKAGLRAFRSTYVDFEPRMVIEQDDGPTSIMGRIEMAQELLRNGFFADTPDAKRARDWAKLASDEGPGADMYEVNFERAQQEELDFLMTGQVPQHLEQELEEAHMDSHAVFVNSPDFLQLDPGMQSSFLEGHVRPTQDALQMKLAASQQMSGSGSADQRGSSPGKDGGGNPGGRPAGPDQMANEPPVNQNQLPEPSAPT